MVSIHQDRARGADSRSQMARWEFETPYENDLEMNLDGEHFVPCLSREKIEERDGARDNAGPLSYPELHADETTATKEELQLPMRFFRVRRRLLRLLGRTQIILQEVLALESGVKRTSIRCDQLFFIAGFAGSKPKMGRGREPFRHELFNLADYARELLAPPDDWSAREVVRKRLAFAKRLSELPWVERLMVKWTDQVQDAFSRATELSNQVSSLQEEFQNLKNNPDNQDPGDSLIHEGAFKCLIHIKKAYAYKNDLILGLMQTMDGYAQVLEDYHRACVRREPWAALFTSSCPRSTLLEAREKEFSYHHLLELRCRAPLRDRASQRRLAVAQIALAAALAALPWKETVLIEWADQTLASTGMKIQTWIDLEKELERVHRALANIPKERTLLSLRWSRAVQAAGIDLADALKLLANLSIPETEARGRISEFPFVQKEAVEIAEAVADHHAPDGVPLLNGALTKPIGQKLKSVLELGRAISDLAQQERRYHTEAWQKKIREEIAQTRALLAHAMADIPWAEEQWAKWAAQVRRHAACLIRVKKDVEKARAALSERENQLKNEKEELRRKMGGATAEYVRLIERGLSRVARARAVLQAGGERYLEITERSGPPAGPHEARRKRMRQIENEINGLCKAYPDLFPQRSNTPMSGATFASGMAQRIKDTEARLLRIRDTVVNCHRGLVVAVARRHVAPDCELDDLVQEGMTGLMRALERFDPRPGYRFSTYATWWIWQGVSRSINENRRVIRIPVYHIEKLLKLRKAVRELNSELQREPDLSEIAKKIKAPEWRVRELVEISSEMLSLEDLISKKDCASELYKELMKSYQDPVEALSKKAGEEIISKLLDDLDSKKREVIQLRYFSSGTGALSLEEIGKRMGVSREKVRQLEREALDELAHRPEARQAGYLFGVLPSPVNGNGSGSPAAVTP